MDVTAINDGHPEHNLPTHPSTLPIYLTLVSTEVAVCNAQSDSHVTIYSSLGQWFPEQVDQLSWTSGTLATSEVAMQGVGRYIPHSQYGSNRTAPQRARPYLP